MIMLSNLWTSFGHWDVAYPRPPGLPLSKHTKPKSNVFLGERLIFSTEYLPPTSCSSSLWIKRRTTLTDNFSTQIVFLRSIKQSRHKSRLVIRVSKIIRLINCDPKISSSIGTANIFSFFHPVSLTYINMPYKSIFCQDILLAIGPNLFFVSQISQQHSIRGRPGGGQGRKAYKPTRGLCNSTWYHDDDDKNHDDDHAMANVKAINF